jgi:RHS repeat-associated protein
LTSYAFTGQFADPATSLQFHRARWLDTRVGRWHSIDQVLDLKGNFASAYVYSGSNPANVTDPSGTRTLGEVAHVAKIFGEVFAGMITGAAFGGHLVAPMLGPEASPEDRARWFQFTTGLRAQVGPLAVSVGLMTETSSKGWLRHWYIKFEFDVVIVARWLMKRTAFFKGEHYGNILRFVAKLVDMGFIRPMALGFQTASGLLQTVFYVLDKAVTGMIGTPYSAAADTSLSEIWQSEDFKGFIEDGEFNIGVDSMLAIFPDAVAKDFNGFAATIGPGITWGAGFRTCLGFGRIIGFDVDLDSWDLSRNTAQGWYLKAGLSFGKRAGFDPDLSVAVTFRFRDSGQIGPGAGEAH